MNMTKTTLLVFSLMVVTFFDNKLALAIESESNVKTLLWPDGTRYVGGIVNGKRTGRGTIFWQEGSRFIGYFENDMRNGPGTMILPDGTVYRGYFKDDKLVYTETSIPTSDPNKIEDIERESLNQTAQVDTDSKNIRNLASRNPLSSPTSSNEKKISEPTPEALQNKIAKPPAAKTIEDTPKSSPALVAKTPKPETIEDTPKSSPALVAKTPKPETIEDTPKSSPALVAKTPKPETIEDTPKSSPALVAKTPKPETIEDTPKSSPALVAKTLKPETIEDTPKSSPALVAKTPKPETIEDTPKSSPALVAKTPKPETIEDTPEPPLTRVGEPILASSTRESLVEAIDQWAKAWSNKNIRNYLSSYSKDFSVPGNRSRKNWESLRKDRLSRPKFIRVTLEYQRFVQVEEDVVDVFFRQTYSSNTYRDVTDKVLRMTKVLRMRKEDSDWKILIERAR
ncbi:MAG: hypothetical protein ACJ0Q2_10415 [Candidatus Azotimanducaceae bacterium]